ncbi:MAG: hypothetical protein ACRERU_02565 [Methylococcales bacterium]
MTNTLSLLNVTVSNGKAVTTFLLVADVFGKQHKPVLRNISSLS